MSPARTRAWGVVLLCASAATVRAQTPLGTAFTYQGQLKDGGSAANGTYDLRFALFDRLVGGTQQGPTVCADNVAVADGLFTLALDFGAQFAGDERFLEIAVRADTGLDCANPTGFVVLTPRQALTAAPYALGLRVPLTLSGTSDTHIIRANNASTAGLSCAVYGLASAGSGNTYGGYFQADSPAGTGVFGLQNAASGRAPAVYGITNSSADNAVAVKGLVVSNNAGDYSAAVLGINNGTGAGGFGVWGSHIGSGSGGSFWSAAGIGAYGQSSGSAGVGVYGSATAVFGGPTHGVYGENFLTGSGVFGWARALSGDAYGGHFESASTAGRGVYGLAFAPTGMTYGVYGESRSELGRGVHGLAGAASGETYGVYGQSNSTDGRAVFGRATAASGYAYGGWFESESTSGIGLFARGSLWGARFESDDKAVSAVGGIGGYFESDALEGGIAVRGHARARIGNSTGVYGLTDSTSGTGVYGRTFASTGATFGGDFECDSVSGVAVRGTATAASGWTYGVRGVSYSPDGTGVYGVHAAGGTKPGVHGLTHSMSPGAAGVLGEANAGLWTDYSAGVRGIMRGLTDRGIGVWGSHDASGWGVFGSSAAGTGVGVVGRCDSTDGYGVYGERPAGGSGYAVYFLNGLAGIGTKSFQMDHPLDPENKYLNHFCTEGPEPLNAYSGNVVTDEKGYATVALPGYFDSINRDFRYQLTVIDDGEQTDFVLAKVVRKIRDNQFVIRTSRAQVEVSWRVEAVRNDRWVQAYGFTAEQEKPAEHKGKYLSPGLYGQPAEMGVHYRPEPERAARPEPEPAAPPALGDSDQAGQR